jgi:hypothetical protein
VTATENKLTIRIKKTFETKNTINKYKDPGTLIGSRYYTHADGPIEVDEKTAKLLIKEGIADAVARVQPTEKAVENRETRERR